MGEDYHNRGKRGDWGQMPERPMFGGSGGRFGGRGRFDHHAGPMGSDRPPRTFFGPGRGQAFPPSSRREGLDRGPGMYPPGGSDWQRPPPPGSLGPDAWQHNRGSRDAAAVGGRDIGFAGRVPSPQDSYSRDWDADKAGDVFGRDREQRDRERDRNRRPGSSGAGGDRGSSAQSRGNTAPAFPGREPDRGVPAWSSRPGARDSQPALSGRGEPGRGERDWSNSGGFTSPDHMERVAGDAHGSVRSSAAAALAGTDVRDGRYASVDKFRGNSSKGSADKEFGPRGSKEYTGNGNSRSGKGDRTSGYRDSRDANHGHKRGDAQRSSSSMRHGQQGPMSGSSDMWSDREGREGSSGRRSADREGREGGSSGRQRSGRDRGVTGPERSQAQVGDVQRPSSSREQRRGDHGRDKERSSSSSRSRARHGSRSRSVQHAAEHQQEVGAKDQLAAALIKPQEEQRFQLSLVRVRQQHTESEDIEAGEVPPSEEPLDHADRGQQQQQQQQESDNDLAAAQPQHEAVGSPMSNHEVSAGSDDHLYSPPHEEAGAGRNTPAVVSSPAAEWPLEQTSMDAASGAQLSKVKFAADADAVHGSSAVVSGAGLSASGHDVDAAAAAPHSLQSLHDLTDAEQQMEVDSIAEAGAAADMVVQDAAGDGAVHAATAHGGEFATGVQFDPTDAGAHEQQLHTLPAVQVGGSMQQPSHDAEVQMGAAAAAPLEDGPAPKRRRLGFGVSLARAGRGGGSAAAVAVAADDTAAAAVSVPASDTGVAQQQTEAEVITAASGLVCETASSMECDEQVVCPCAADEAEAATNLPAGMSEQQMADGEQQQQQQQQQPDQGEQVADVQPEGVPGQPSKAEITRALQQLEDETGQLEQQLDELNTSTDALTTQLALLDQELAQISARDLWPAAKQQLAAALQEQQRLEQEQLELLQQQREQQVPQQRQQQILEHQAATFSTADEDGSSAMRQLECLEPPLMAATESADECLQPVATDVGEVEGAVQLHGPGHHAGAYRASAFGSSRLQEYLWNLPHAVASRQQAVLQQNKQIASTARTDLVKLLPEELHQEAQAKLSAAQPLEKRYDTVQDLEDIWQQLMEQREENGGAVARFLAQRRVLLNFKHIKQSDRYKQCMGQFQAYLKAEQEAATAAAAAAAAAAPVAGSAWGQGRQPSGNLGGGRSTRAAAGAAASYAPYQPDVIKSVYDEERLMQVFRAVEDLKHMSLLPQQMQDPWQRRWQGFASNNSLVEDPVREQQEDKMGLDWSEEEKKIFMERFLQFPKDFRKISNYLENRTPAECVVFFYKHQKLDEFAHVRRKQQLKKRRQTAETKRLWAASMRPMAMNSMREAAEQREQRRENREREREIREREAAAAAAATTWTAAAADRAAMSWDYTAFSVAAVGTSSRAGRGGRGSRKGGRGRARGAAAAVTAGSAAAVEDDDDDADYNPHADPATLAVPVAGLGARRLSNEDGGSSDFTAGGIPDDVFVQAVMQYGRNMTAISNYVTAAGYPKSVSYVKWFYGRQKKRLDLEDIAERCLAERRVLRGAAAAAPAAEDEEEVVDYAAAAAAMQGYMPGDPAAVAAALQHQYAGFMATGATTAAAGVDGFRMQHSGSVTALDHMPHNAPAAAAAAEYIDGANEQADYGDTSTAAAGGFAAAGAGAGARRGGSAWSDAERELFLHHFSQEGKNWSRLAQLIPSKTAIQVKSYYSNNRRKLDLDSLLPAGVATAAAVSKGGRGRSRANSMAMGELVTSHQQQQLLHGAGVAGDYQMNDASRLMMAAVAAAQDAANAHGHGWQQLPGSSAPAAASDAAGGGQLSAGPSAAALLALLQEGRLLSTQGSAESGAANSAAAVASSAGLSAVSGHPSALLSVLQMAHQQQPVASAAAAEGSVSGLFHTHTGQQQSVLAHALLSQLQAVAPNSLRPVMSLLGNAASQAAAVAPTAPAAAGAATAGFPEQLALLSQLAHIPNVSAAPAMVAEQRPVAAAAAPGGVNAGEIAQLLAAQLGVSAEATPAAGGTQVAGQLLAHLSAAAQAQYQQQQQQVLQQLLGDRAHGQPLSALLNLAQQQEQQQVPVALFLAAVTAAAAAAREHPQRDEHVGQRPLGQTLAAEEVDPLKALQQTLSTLKADLGLDAGALAAAPNVSGGVQDEQPAAKRHKANPALRAAMGVTAVDFGNALNGAGAVAGDQGIAVAGAAAGDRTTASAMECEDD